MEDTETKELERSNGRRGLAEKLESLGWGLFFIWLGVAFLLDLGWGVGLLGVGLITLGGQAARVNFELPVEGFWVVVGSCFLLGGIWHFLGTELPLLPILLVVAGVVALLSAVLPSRGHQASH